MTTDCFMKISLQSNNKNILLIPPRLIHKPHFPSQGNLVRRNHWMSHIMHTLMGNIIMSMVHAICLFVQSQCMHHVSMKERVKAYVEQGKVKVRYSVTSKNSILIIHHTIHGQRSYDSSAMLICHWYYCKSCNVWNNGYSQYQCKESWEQ